MRGFLNLNWPAVKPDAATFKYLNFSLKNFCG